MFQGSLTIGDFFGQFFDQFWTRLLYWCINIIQQRDEISDALNKLVHGSIGRQME